MVDEERRVIVGKWAERAMVEGHDSNRQSIEQLNQEKLQETMDTRTSRYLFAPFILLRGSWDSGAK